MLDPGDGLQPVGLNLQNGTSIENSQCRILNSGSSVSDNATEKTLTLNITFKPGFAGPKIVYAATQTKAGGNSGWQAMGVWSVP